MHLCEEEKDGCKEFLTILRSYTYIHTHKRICYHKIPYCFSSQEDKHVWSSRWSYVRDPLVDLPRPSAEDPPVEFLRSGAENPPLELLRPSEEQIFFSIYREKVLSFMRSGTENPALDLPRPGAHSIFFTI